MISFKIKDTIYSVNEKRHRIEDILLVGSLINGDYEEKSDIDFYIVIDNCSPRVRQQTFERIAQELNVPKYWITFFTKDEFQQECNQGRQNYYFWYVRLKHKKIYSRNNFAHQALQRMPLFSDVDGLLQMKRNHIRSIMSEVRANRYSDEEAINQLARVIRDTCINICFLQGYLEFGKYKPVELCYQFKTIKMPFSYANYRHLYRIKRAYKFDKGNFALSGDVAAFIETWYVRYKKLSQEALRLCEDVQTKDFKNPLQSFISS
ncbi:hypothetical protein A374_11170 [Fictibacillus macauensis ZFHKF-1]|uniref:Polymerase nucleotidyl transferase domain-containing protein n=1 Tax=Fictibacillus macauensis ZFHKF-1 TaxID=1196324 RepID=I8UEG5_9BACL|nr:nucleotidyltransferase domain-containing protein [Fictibacillus macauensis]EIT85300.1 hypothetical protein A374_11170 [Fictibacillus macauensis ZFHKF-1]